MLTQIVGALLIPKDERAIIEAAKAFAAEKIGKGCEGSFDAVISQLKGEIPMAVVTHKVIEFIQKGSSSPLWQTAVDVGLNHLEAKGFGREVVASLVARFSRHLGVDPVGEGSPAERIAADLGNIATQCEPKYAPVIGALVVCPECGYTHII